MPILLLCQQISELERPLEDALRGRVMGVIVNSGALDFHKAVVKRR